MEECNVNASAGEMLNRAEVMESKNTFWILKRTQDIILSALALIVLSPLMLLVALAIYIDDPAGSPFFVQARIGKDGKPFRFIKFRSMVVDAEAKLNELMSQNEMDGPAFKIKDDPRITKVGRFIRKTSIDELPQLINILRGEMSIVGPRPAIPREVAQYTDYQRQRLLVTPGLTCYWQVQPQRNTLTFDEWVALDIKYIKERSFLLDWKLIFRTIGVVLHLDSI